MTRNHIPNHRIDNGFDRQNLNEIQKRFDAINHQRRQRLHAALPEQHQLFVDALPILFHCNHPMLPGFNGRHTPCKISGFKPTTKDINSAKKLALSFTISYEPDISEDIFAVFIMGSVGTIAQSKRSDLDIWLCHRPGLKERCKHHLLTKCEKISQWAKEHHLDAHIFLMDDEAFRQGHIGTLDKESSGSAQRQLLLDEFYRSAIHIAGRKPLWELVPDNQERHYKQHAATLLERRFINPVDFIDFGGAGHIPEGEFVGAGFWQLYKAIESPYKSVLKLLLLEIYVSEYPAIRALCLDYKRMIFNGELDIDQLDSYVMIYRRIETYLKSKNQHKRLELARRCFYFKVGRALSHRAKHTYRPWQRTLMQDLVNEWQWSDAGLKLLDDRANWKVGTVASEQALLVAELNHSYRFLLEFAQSNQIGQVISDEELTVLGRKLQAAFERRPGKVEWINPNISKDLSEDIIAVTHHKSSEYRHSSWTAHSLKQSIQASDGESIRTAPSLVELLLWCIYNGLIEAHTRIDLSDVPEVPTKACQKIIDLLRQWLPQANESIKHERFFSAATPTRTLWLINVANEASPELNKKGLQRLSNHSDALCYGEQRESLVCSVDFISVNSWNEVHVRHFSGVFALIDALKEYMLMAIPGTQQQAPTLQVECIGEQHSSLIHHRVETWLNDIMQCFYRPAKQSTRYLFKYAHKFHSLRLSNKRPVIDSFSQEKYLVSSLTDARQYYSGLTLDSRFAEYSPLAFIAQKMRRNTITVYYQYLDIGMQIFIADEKGALFHTATRGVRQHNPLIPLHRFLRSTINRQARVQPDLLADFGVCPIYFYELSQQADNHYTGKQRPVSKHSPNVAMFDLKAVAHSQSEHTINYDFYCEDQVFTADKLRNDIYQKVAQSAISKRKKHAQYPLYLTDLDLSTCTNDISEDGQLQIIHYLQIKFRLEEKLNKAIGVILNA